MKSLRILPMLVVGLLLLVASLGNVAAQGTPIEIMVSHNNPQGSPEDEGLQAFKEALEARTDGRVQVQIYPALQLGSMREQVESTQYGVIHITQQPTAVLSNFAPVYELVDFPYLWPDLDTFFEVMEGELGDQIHAQAEQEGLVGLGWMVAGFKQFTANRAITSPDDLRGARIRVMPAPLLSSQMQAWGANPTQIDFGELYNSLQQGVVDGQENPIKTIYLNRLFEVQDYLILSDHGLLAYGIVANKDWFDALPEDIQLAIRESMKEASRVQRQILADVEGQMLEEIRAHEDTEVIELSQEARAQLREQARAVYQEFAPRVGPDLLEAVQAEIDRVNNR